MIVNAMYPNLGLKLKYIFNSRNVCGDYLI